MNLRIERSPNPSTEERQAILMPLRAYNASKSAGPPPEHIALLVRDDNDEIVGGVYARLFYQWLFMRPAVGAGAGPGTRHGHQVDADGRRPCARRGSASDLWLDTFEFQAPAFYRKCGYSEIGHIADYPPGHKHFFFQKRLS